MKEKSTALKWVMLAALLVFMLTGNLHAQDNSVSGQVISQDDNQPLPGVSVVIKGTSLGTVSDGDGNFKIRVSKGSTLVFSFLGMEPMEYLIGDQTSINVTLITNITNLNEVVVTALGLKRDRKSLGYSVAEVSGSQLSTALEVNPINSLSGKVAGVDISLPTSGPSGSSRVVIRGNSSLSSDNQPLYVIDGVPMENTQVGGNASQWGGYDLGNGVSNLNANDIETVTVLKGASASALYGSRATNGVILITTKSGKAQRGVGIEFTSNYTVEKVLSKFDDYQTTYGQGRDGNIPNEDNILTSQVAWGAKLDPTLSVPIYNKQLKPYGAVDNNILSFFRTGSTATNSVSLSGGSDKASIRASVSDMRNRDIIPNTGLNRNTFLLNASLKLGQKITVTGKANYVTEKVNNRPALSDNPNNVGLAVIGIAPNFDQHWLGEDYKDEYGNYIDWNGSIYRINPYWSVKEMSNESTKNRIMGFLQLNYEFTDWLNLQVRGGTDFYNWRYSNFAPRSTPTTTAGSLDVFSQGSSESNYEGLLNFNKQLGQDFTVRAFVGGNIRYTKKESMLTNGKGIVLPDVKTINNFTNQSNEYRIYEKQVNSVFGSAQFGYKDTYFLDATFRNDWSSTLKKGNNSYFYPSVSGSFVFSNLIKNQTPLTFGKLRASYAEVGGDTEPYQLNLNYGLKSYSLLGKPLGEISNTSIPNASLKPTHTFSYEFGTELRAFSDHVRLDASYYHTSTVDQILPLGISAVSGYNAAYINAGEITNQGIEILLSGTPVSVSGFTWDVTLNYSRNRNKVVKLHNDVKTYLLANARWAGAAVVAKEGESYGAIVGQTLQRDPNGNVIFNDAGLPTFNQDQQVLGSGVYKWISGINNTFSYKAFKLSALVDLKVGAQMYSMSSALAYTNGTATETLEGRDAWYASEEARLAANVSPANWVPTGGYVGKGVVNTGTSENPVYVENTKFVNPQTYWGTFLTGSPEPFIYSATYAKLREVIFSYTLPSKFIAKTPIQSVSLSFVARNLFILYSDTPNIDPESNYNNGNGQGLEYGSIPSRKSYGFSLNVKF